MTINHTENGAALTVTLDGRLDTVTAPQLEAFLKEHLDGKTALSLDFASLAYISSAGLRVLLSTQKAMNGKGTMTVCNVNAEIAEIFDITGFADILTIV